MGGRARRFMSRQSVSKCGCSRRCHKSSSLGGEKRRCKDLLPGGNSNWVEIGGGFPAGKPVAAMNAGPVALTPPAEALRIFWMLDSEMT